MLMEFYFLLILMCLATSLQLMADEIIMWFINMPIIV